MAYFKRNFKYNIQKKLIHYGRELDSRNSLIEVEIELNNKL